MNENHLFISHILSAIADIENMNKGGKEAFFNSISIKHGTCRCFEIIGEASTRLSKEFKLLHLEIDWRKVIGLRNVIIHQYHAIDYEVIWDLTQNEIPPLKIKLNEIMTAK
jgi:uncharacterized protein with HEPN domain